MTKHAEDLAKLGWQYFECPACGSEGARAFPKPAQPQQEPFATVIGKFLAREDKLRTCIEPELPLGTKLYTSPPAQRTWVGLTDDELADFWFKQSLDWMEFARVIEDALRSNNT